MIRWANPLSRVVDEALTEGRRFGLGGMDALHVAAARLLEADELVTVERLGKPLLRVTSITVRSIHPSVTAFS